jgi:hypothetical protein
MANQKISELNELLSPLSGDTLPIVNNGETKKVTVNNLLSGSNVQPFFHATDTGSGLNVKLGSNGAWIGDSGFLDTVQITGILNPEQGYIRFGSGSVSPRIGHTSEDADTLTIEGFLRVNDPVLIGSGSLVSGDPEMIRVYSSGSYNIANFLGETETYSQINVKNMSSNAGASSDIVATADNGDETIHYVNMGINSSGFDNEFSIGYQNDAYVYNAGQDMYVGVIDPVSPNHGNLHLFSQGLWQNPSINIVESGSVAFGTGSVTDGFSFEFSGSVKLQNDLQVDGSIQSDGSMFLQPDINDSRNIEIYNTDSTDIHIKGNATYTFFGDDSNYVKIDNGLEKITINTNSGTTINGLLNLSPVIELPTGSTLGDMVVSGSNLYFHNGIGWNSLNMTSI